VQDEFLARVGLLKNHSVAHRETLRLYLLSARETLAWVAERAGVNRVRAGLMLLAVAARTTLREKVISLRMRKIFRDASFSKSLISAAPEQQPYRNADEIRNLFQRLAIPIRQFQTLSTCCIVEV